MFEVVMAKVCPRPEKPQLPKTRSLLNNLLEVVRRRNREDNTDSSEIVALKDNRTQLEKRANIKFQTQEDRRE